MYACAWTYAKQVYVLFMSSTLGIVFNPSAGVITDHSQLANDIYPYLKSQLYFEALDTERQYSFYRMAWMNPESERTAEINFCRGMDSTP